MLWYQTDLITVKLLPACCLTTEYYMFVSSVGTKSAEVFSERNSSPQKVSMQELNNRQFLQPPPLVQKF